MVKRGNLNVPVIGVAKAGWNLDQLKARAKDSLEKHGGLTRPHLLLPAVALCGRRYEDAAIFQAIAKNSVRLNALRIPAILPVLFGTVGALGKSGCARPGRVWS
jgi:glucose-6-phosphate 1-dehydrogenase